MLILKICKLISLRFYIPINILITHTIFENLQLNGVYDSSLHKLQFLLRGRLSSCGCYMCSTSELGKLNATRLTSITQYSIPDKTQLLCIRNGVFQFNRNICFMNLCLACLFNLTTSTKYSPAHSNFSTTAHMVAT